MKNSDTNHDVQRPGALDHMATGWEANRQARRSRYNAIMRRRQKDRRQDRKEKAHLGRKMRKLRKERQERKNYAALKQAIHDANRVAAQAERLAWKCEQLSKRTTWYADEGPSVDDGNLSTLTTRFYLSSAFIAGVYGVDIVFLSDAVQTLLDSSGVTAEWLLTMGKLLLPGCIITVELASIKKGWRPETVERLRDVEAGENRDMNTRDVGRTVPLSSYPIPASIALLAGASFLIGNGVSSLADFDLLTAAYFLAIMAFGWSIHYYVLVLGENIYEGIAQFVSRKTSRQHDKAVIRQEKAEAKVEAIITGYELAVEDYNVKYEADLKPRYDLLSKSAIQILEKRRGRPSGGEAPAAFPASTEPPIPPLSGDGFVDAAEPAN